MGCGASTDTHMQETDHSDVKTATTIAEPTANVLGDCADELDDSLEEFDAWCRVTLQQPSPAPQHCLSVVRAAARAAQRHVDCDCHSLARIHRAFQRMLSGAWATAVGDPVVVQWHPLGDPYWTVVRSSATIVARRGDAELAKSALYGVVSQLALSGGQDDVADAVAATQALLYAAYAGAQSGRRAIRESLVTLSEALAARCVAVGSAADALLLGSVLRIATPLLSGFSEIGGARRESYARRLVEIARAFAAPKAFEAFGSALLGAFRGVFGGTSDAEDTALIVQSFRSLCDRFSQAGHAEMAGLSRFLGALLPSLSASAYEQVRQQVIASLCRGLASDVASVAIAAASAALTGLLPLLQSSHDAETEHHRALARALVRDGRLHWDVDATLEFGALWQELDDVLESRWAAAVSDVLRSSTVTAQQRDFPKRLLSKCAEVRQQRDEDAALAQARRGEAVAAIQSRGAGLRRLDFVFGRELGSGTFASVRFAKFIEPDVPQRHWLAVAVKSVLKSVMKLNEEASEALEREATIHRALSDDVDVRDGIAHLHARFDDGGYHTCFVQELGTHGDLHTAITTAGIAHDARGALAVKGLHAWVRHALNHVRHTLCSIHRKGFVFGDLKPENILVFPDGRAKLCDFGSAMALELVATSGCHGGTMHYLAPEALDATMVQSVRGEALDWWAFAATTVFALTGRLLFDSDDHEQLRRQILGMKTREDVERRLHELTDEACQHLPNFVATVLAMHPEDRATNAARVIAADAFFADAPAPFENHAVPMPPRLHVTTGGSAPSSGRKQSVMWRRHAGAAADIDPASIAIDVLAGERRMEAEPEGTPDGFEYEPFALPNPQAREVSPPSQGYMTVMPPMRR